jgi:hypothetical protein
MDALQPLMMNGDYRALETAYAAQEFVTPQNFLT